LDKDTDANFDEAGKMYEFTKEDQMEEFLVYKVLKSVVYPHLSVKDLALFDAILKDLFPNMATPIKFDELSLTVLNPAVTCTQANTDTVDQEKIYKEVVIKLQDITETRMQVRGLSYTDNYVLRII
jgi:hypothetical protein